MLRCKPDGITLDPIKAVSDHLSERVTLETTEESMPFYSDFKSQVVAVKKNKCTASSGEQQAYSQQLGGGDPTMNSNLMLRSMFFMNDEPRHFLAPPIPNQVDYLRVKQHQLSQPEEGGSGDKGVGVAGMAGTGAGKQRPHACEECGKSFLLKHHLATHARVHTGERPHACPDCGKTFALKHCLSTHLLLHSAERPYKCNECSKTFTLKHHLVSHEKIHTRERPFECRECGQRFAQKRHLSTHLKYHSGERPYSCQVCGETFTREEHVVAHSRFHGGLEPYTCPDCGAGFLRKFQLVEHEREHGRTPPSCPTCGKEFLQKRTLLLHIRTCGLPHANLLTLPSNQDKLCKECGETFSSAEGLALHTRLHVGDHSFISDICSLAASVKQHSGVGATQKVRSHVCCDCGRGFTQRHGLQQHALRYPGGSCKLRPHVCPKCGKTFAQRNHLALHERQHMDKTPSLHLKQLSDPCGDCMDGSESRSLNTPRPQCCQPSQSAAATQVDGHSC